jgi:Na+/H+ antiporter NhaD/arsenite permease-like protein
MQPSASGLALGRGWWNIGLILVVILVVLLQGAVQLGRLVLLFAAIFVTIGPVIDMPQAGTGGPLEPLLRLTLDGADQPRPIAYFWLTGTLSAFLDTYIGNAHNMMLRAIAAHRDVRMPGFFGFMLLASCLLLPVLALVSLLFFL